MPINVNRCTTYVLILIVNENSALEVLEKELIFTLILGETKSVVRGNSVNFDLL